MSKKKTYDPQHEFDVLSSEIRADGEGEHQAVKDMLSDKFVTGSDVEAGAIASQLAQLITGMEMSNRQFNTIMERFEKMEKAQQAWELDKQKFLEEVERRSEKLIATTQAQKDKYAVEWMEEARKAKQEAVAEAAVASLAFERLLATEPKETIISAGVTEIYREGDQLIPRVTPDVIAIKNKKWVLPPGEAVEVPHTVAVRYREIMQQRAALKERQDLMRDGKTEANVVAEEWRKINEKYKLGGDNMPSVNI